MEADRRVYRGRRILVRGGCFCYVTRPERGEDYFYGGPAATSTGTQLITLAAGAASSINLAYVLSGWLGGYDGQDDYATLFASFEGPDGKTISKSKIGPVTEAQRNGTSELLFRQVSGSVPATTQAVLVQLVMQRFGGSDNDGMADNLSFVLSASAAKGTSTTTTPGNSTMTTTGSSVQLSPQTVIVPAATVRRFAVRLGLRFDLHFLLAERCRWPNSRPGV